ncbi:glycine cleavage system protein H [Deltaproteobacteria bacterium Smac51]|nr:glycine cleavage system protein H [Deltaproteobacteria bacterium Smac51]
MKEATVDLHALRYSPERLWVRLEDDNQVTIGLTDEALEDYDELTKIRLPAEGDEFSKDEPFGRLSVGSGTGLRLLSPVSGEVVAINEDIVDAPEAILEDPYEEGWLIRMDLNSMSEYDDLMTREEYDDFIDEEYGDDDAEDEEDEDFDEDEEGYEEEDDDEYYYDDDDE